VTEKTLPGKSDDVRRSHGFFIKVRERLVNENDALFGLNALEHGTFNRFRADLFVDDLDDDIKASREATEESSKKELFRKVIKELFNEAAARYSKAYQQKQSNPKIEGERKIVNQRFFEFPIADAIILNASDKGGAEADNGWFYLDLDDIEDYQELIKSLYSPESSKNKYTYQYTSSNPTARLVSFKPTDKLFILNESHPLIREYLGDPSTRRLLEDFVTAEALLEVYLIENQMPAHIVGNVLQQRDNLLRSLAEDRSYSMETISRKLLDSASNEHELEINLVVALRALGFVTKHISNAGQPDGIARFTDYPQGEKVITLEAKSSLSVPSLSSIDFAGLQEHAVNLKADGCLLLAPDYPGGDKGENSAASNRARELRISCWTIEQLAAVIKEAERKHLNANDILTIVLNKFAPDDVSIAVNELLTNSMRNKQDLYKAILESLKKLEHKLKDEQRSITMIAGVVSMMDTVPDVSSEDIRQAIKDLAGASQGGMTLRDDKVIIHVVLEELERRLSILTKENGTPRRLSGFRN
jgi:hypothetical protein